MKRPSYFTLVFITVMILYTFVYVVHVGRNPKYPFEVDIPTYAAALVQAEHPELFSRDPVYRDGYVTRLHWSSSYAYMNLFRGLYSLTQENISTTIALLQFIPAFTLTLTFFWLLCAFPFDRWLSFMFSLGLSYWVILNRLEGIPTAFYYACLPMFLRLLWQFLVEPCLQGRPVILWRVVATGMLIGISPMLINSVNGLAFNALILILVTIQFLARRMRWQAYAALLVGLLPFLCFAALGGTGGANALQDEETARFVFNDLPTGTLNAAIALMTTRIEVFDAGVSSFLFYIPLSALIAVLSLLVRYIQSPTRTLKIIYLSVNAIFWLWVLGNIGIVLYLYFLSRIWQRRETSLDYVFIMGMSVGVFIGPPLLWLLALVWKAVQWHSLVFIMWQMFRFHLLTYFIAAVALVFMIDDLTRRINNVSTRFLTYFLFILLLGLQRMQWPVISVSFLSLVALVLLFIHLLASRKIDTIYPFIATSNNETVTIRRVVGMLACVSMMMLAFWGIKGIERDPSAPLTSPPLFSTSQDVQASGIRMKEDYMDMTHWLRVHTPLDSLIHLEYEAADSTGYFRFLTQRSMFFSSTDQNVGQFSPGLAASNRQLLKDIKGVPLLLFGSVLLKYRIDYLVVHHHYLLPLPALDRDGWYVPVPVYSNQSYAIYQMQKLSTETLISRLFSTE